MADADDDPLAVRRKRIRFRSWHRGVREADLLLGGFADRHLDGMTAAELDQFEAVLEVPDPDLIAWYMRRRPVPAGLGNPMLDLILKFKIYE